jgi:hypothetical protein
VATNTISEQTISEIKLLAEIAKLNNSHVSIKDIATLTSTEMDEAGVRNSCENDPRLQVSFDLTEDLVLDRTEEHSENSIVQSFEERRARANDFIRFAHSIQAFCRTRGTGLFSVSGSTSYYSTSPGDDLDFFTITADENLWFFLLKSMIFTRINRILHPESPRTCFSYTVDYSFAKKAFASDDPLFARDALNIVVLHGQGLYDQLLRQSSWMSSYFPRLYQLKTDHRQKNVDCTTGKSLFRHILNYFLFLTMGRYVRVKSALVKRRLQSQAKTSSLFTLRSGPDHFIFESVRYLRLRQVYGHLGRTIRRNDATNGAT